MDGARIAFGTLVLATALGVVYFLNPLHTPSYDPRLRFWGVTLFRAPTRAMEPTIKPGEVFLVFAWPYRAKDPIAGNIVVFQYPADPSVAYVKRVIATGDSTVEIRDGIVVVNGTALSEPYIDRNRSATKYSRTMPLVRVPSKSYFVLGDNRDDSRDSRTWGFVPRSNIIGEVYR
jgi:signal peptidase I